jgi:hypothetical protein
MKRHRKIRFVDVKVSDIEWDVDSPDEAECLPRSLTINSFDLAGVEDEVPVTFDEESGTFEGAAKEIVEDMVVDYLTEGTGFCVAGCSVEFSLPKRTGKRKAA